MSRPDSRPFVRFLCVSVLLYALAVTPWPGAQEAYSRYFCSFARLMFSERTDERILHFNTVPAIQRNRTLDTRVTVIRPPPDAGSSGSTVMLDLDSRGLGWIPTALFCSLVFATPLSWPRRLRALLLGLLAVHVLIFIALLSSILDLYEMIPELGLDGLSPFWKSIVAGLDETLVNQLGAGLVASVLIWVVVSFRFDDIDRLRGSILRSAVLTQQGSSSTAGEN